MAEVDPELANNITYLRQAIMELRLALEGLKRVLDYLEDKAKR